MKSLSEVSMFGRKFLWLMFSEQKMQKFVIEKSETKVVLLCLKNGFITLSETINSAKSDQNRLRGSERE